jgi:hypothetical protein
MGSHDASFSRLDFGPLENDLSWEPGAETGVSREWKSG